MAEIREILVGRIYILAMLVILWVTACGWYHKPKPPTTQLPPPIAFQPACAGLPADYKMDLLRLSERLSQKGRTVVIGSCQGECGFLVSVNEQYGTVSASQSEASDSGLTLQLPATIEGKPVCVQEGESPAQ